MMIGKPEQKVYGLSFPTRTSKEKPKTHFESVFATESDEESTTAQLKPLKVQSSAHSGHSKLHRKTKSDYEKAMEEDPSVFQYDEIYDDIRSEKDRQVNDILGGSKKESKYVGRLLKTAEERKLERELCLERKAQKEIEADAAQYGDKEAFVTSAYKEKLKQLRELVSKREEEQIREDYMDITKQQGLSGFYRYMYQHGMKSEECSTPTDSSSRMYGRQIDQKPHKHVLNEQKDKPEKRETSSRNSSQSHRRSPKSSSPRDEIPERSSVEYCHSSTSRRESSGHRDRKDTELGRADSPRKSHSSVRVDSDKYQTIPKSERTSPPKETKGDRSSDVISSSKSDLHPVPRPPPDPNYIYARPRITTDAQIEEARQRYLARKATGIHPVIADSDSD